MKAKLLRGLGFDATRLASGWLLERAGSDIGACDAILDDLVARRELGRLLRHFAIDCVLDVGANIGQFGLDLRKHGFTGHIASFEPVAEVRAELARHAAADSSWRVYPYALGRDSGTAPLHVLAGKTLSSLRAPVEFSRQRFGDRVDVTRVEAVEVRRLDEVLDEVAGHLDKPRILLKMDTQGFDLEVFAGVGARIGEVVAIQAELTLVPLYEGTPRMCEALAVYQDAGFEIASMHAVSRDHVTGRVIEYDCVLVRPDAIRLRRPSSRV